MRVKELEFTHELYQGRVLELEASLADARNRADTLEMELKEMRQQGEAVGRIGGKRKSDAIESAEELEAKKARLGQVEPADEEAG